MPVKATSAYAFAPKDSQDKFPAPLLYIGWDSHKMFCAPFCAPMAPTMRFDELVHNALPGMYGAHPDFARIDWQQVQWLRDGLPFCPAMDQSLADNGLGHKSVLRFRTPGLNGLSGSSF